MERLPLPTPFGIFIMFYAKLLKYLTVELKVFTQTSSSTTTHFRHKILLPLSSPGAHRSVFMFVVFVFEFVFIFSVLCLSSWAFELNWRNLLYQTAAAADKARHILSQAAQGAWQIFTLRQKVATNLQSTVKIIIFRLPLSHLHSLTLLSLSLSRSYCICIFLIPLAACQQKSEGNLVKQQNG